MAVKYSELNKKDKRPFDEVELQWLKEVEDYIDAQILEQFKTKDRVHILLSVVNFDYDPINDVRRSIKTIRKQMMRKEIDRRYTAEANWKIYIHMDDGLDGPDMSGPDYWILTGNRV